MSIIIGIDHGYYAIKTAHCSFPAGLTSYGEHEPYTRQGLLEFGGCFFVCGSGRQPIQRDKTVNDNYYLLTLAAIAKEIRQRGLPPECSVRIAAGLPLTSFGRDKPKFRDYLLRSNQPVNYKFEGVEYSITIEEVAVFPQGYAALMTEVGLLQDEPSMLLMDLGGWTVDLMRIDNAIPVADTAHSLELGMIRCVDDIREQVRRETGLSLTDAQIENTIPKDVFQCDPFIVTVDANSPQSRFTVLAGSATTPSNDYMTFNVLDEELEGYLQLIKTDTETGKAVKIANTVFALYRLDEKDRKTRISMIDPASGSATKKTDVFYTDADGLMKTPEKLPLGRYLIEELQGPEGYFNDPAYSVEFEIKSDRVWQVVGNATNDMDEYIVTEKYCNHETLGQLTIRKQGNVLTDYKNGQFVYTQDNLAGAVYEIHAAADIATPDRQGTYWYKSGDLVATVITGAEGQVDEVKFSPTRTQATYDFLKVSHDGTKGEVTVTLPLGKYTITEVQAPYGFVLTQQSHTVEFSWDNQKNDIVLAKTIVSHEQDGDKECSYSIVNVKDASDAHKIGQILVFENARVLPTPEKPGDKVSKIGVGIYKQDREALTYLPGAVYELYTVDDIYSADGTKLLDAGTKLATSSATNASGFTWFDVDVPIRGEYYIDPAGPRSTSRENSGRYRIVEITAPAGYLLDSTPMEVTFTYEGQQIAWQIVDGTNTNLRTTVDISKQDITNGKELPGAKLEIRDADGNLVEGWTSGKTPHTVRGLELEKEYTLTEKRAPDGYAEAESIVFKLVQEGTEQVNEVYVKSNDDWVKLDDATVIMQDAPVLDVDKTDIAGNLLPGAALTIRDADGKVIDTWVTDYKTHRVPISDDSLKLSDDSKEYIYTLTEDAAPAGFEIAESVQFKIQQADERVCLFVRKNADAEWVRADKRLIQMIDEATPREDTPTPTPTPTPQPTPAATPAPTPAPTPHKMQTLPQTGDGFPLLAIVVVALASATGIVLLTVKQKNALKETSDEEDADESTDR